MAGSLAEQVRKYKPHRVGEEDYMIASVPILSKGFLFCTGMVFLSNEDGAFVSHRFQPERRDFDTAFSRLGEDLRIFGLVGNSRYEEMLEEVLLERGLALTGIHRGYYDSKKFKHDNKDLLVIPEERRILVYSNMFPPKEYRI